MTEYDFKNPRDYRILSTGLKPPSSNYSNVECPFCQTRFRAYWWSIAGSGKKCENRKCGAIHFSSGVACLPVKK